MESKTFAQKLKQFFFPKKEILYYIYIPVDHKKVFQLQFVVIDKINGEEYLSHTVSHRRAEKFTQVRAMRFLKYLNEPPGNNDYKMINCKKAGTLYED